MADVVKLPSVNDIDPLTGNKYVNQAQFLASDGIIYVLINGTWTASSLKGNDKAPAPGQETGSTLLAGGNQPDVLFKTGTPSYQGSTFIEPKAEPMAWYDAVYFMDGLRAKKDKSEYNKYVDALVHSGFWDKGKKVTNATVDKAWKSALRGSSANTIDVQSLLFDPETRAAYTDNAVGDSTKKSTLSYYTNLINNTALQKGVTLTPAEVKSLTTKAMSNSWDVVTLQQNVAQTGTIDFAKGGAAATVNDLKKWAADNGMSFDDTWFQTAASNILTGKSTLDTEKQTINSYAKGLYSAEPFVKGIDSGFSIRQQASPYINYLAKIRGVDPTSISLDDPVLKKNLTKRDDKGNPVIPSYYDFTLDVRKNDPSWGYSLEAQNETTSMLNKFGSMFGKVSG